MSIYIAPTVTRDNPKFGTSSRLITLDAFISENHNYTNVVQSHPIEKGESITDDSYHEPTELELECVISPYGISEETRASHDRADSAYRDLMKLRTAQVPVSVITGLTSYSNMAITNITIPRAKANSQTLRFNISFKKVRIVGAVSVEVDILGDTSELYENGELLGYTLPNVDQILFLSEFNGIPEDYIEGSEFFDEEDQSRYTTTQQASIGAGQQANFNIEDSRKGVRF